MPPGAATSPPTHFHGLRSVPALTGGSPRLQGSELTHHAKIIPDRPALGDASVDEAINEHDLPGIGTLGYLHAEEDSSWPVAAAQPVLHHAIVFRDDNEVLPSVATQFPPGRGQELSGSVQTGGSSGANAWLTMSGVHSWSSCSRSPLLTSASNRSTTILFCCGLIGITTLI
jgi:hypothetical protein